MLDARGLSRIVLAMILLGAVHAGAMAAPPPAQGPTTGMFQTPAQAYTEALCQSIGAPARAQLGPDAFVRLSEDLIIVPHDQAVRLLTLWDLPVPPDFTALLLGPKGMASPGIIRYVPAGFIDAAAAAALTADDMLSSLTDTIEQRNAARLSQQLPELEVRGWVRPPHYDAEAHQISWAALILPKMAPLGTDGEITFNAVGFGRHGYIRLSMATSVQEAADVSQMFDNFLSGLGFRPGEAYGDLQPADKRAPDGIAGALEMDTLHKARNTLSFWMSDKVIPAAGGLVAVIGALSLLIYIRRHLYRESRCW
jgi:uncharacterized membrane-anchored protein